MASIRPLRPRQIAADDDDDYDNVRMRPHALNSSISQVVIIFGVIAGVIAVIAVVALLARDKPSSTIVQDTSGPSDLESIRARTNLVYNALTGESGRPLGVLEQIHERTMSDSANSIASVTSRVLELERGRGGLIGLGNRGDEYNSAVPLHEGDCPNIFTLSRAADRKGMTTVTLRKGYAMTVFSEIDYRGNQYVVPIDPSASAPFQVYDLPWWGYSFRVRWVG